MSRPILAVVAVGAVAAGLLTATTSPAAFGAEPAAPVAAADSTGSSRSGCTPRVFAPGVISTAQNESKIAFTPDGRTAYFGRSDTPGALEDSAIYETHRRGNGWTEPRVVPFSGEYDDLDPFVTRDNRRLLFASTRPVDGEPRGVNIWYVERTRSGAWGEPRPLESVNTEANELFPSIADDGTLYFNSNRPGGHGDFDLYRARPARDGTYRAAENLGPTVNTDGPEFNPTPLPGNAGVIFASLNRAGSVGPIDLWLTLRTPHGWTTPRNLGAPVNSEQSEFHPSFSPRYDELFFVRLDAGAGRADLYHLPTRCLLPA